jgi:hypothetical protein
VTNLYAGLIALIMFAEMMPTLRWKTAPHTSKKILLEQGPFISTVYYITTIAFSAVNIFKGTVFFLFIMSQNMSSTFLSYFLSSTPILGATGEALQLEISKAKREGGFTLIMETILIFMLIMTVQRYRPLIISAKDAIFYRDQMVDFT